MDIKTISGKVSSFLNKYKFALIVLTIGLILLAIPVSENENNTVAKEEKVTVSEKTMEERISSVLSQIKGAGNVQVMLTEAAGEEVLYQTNDNNNIAENTNTSKRDTVIITDANRNQNGLVRKINPPEYLGAVVVCQGADNPSVQLAIVDAVSKLTGLGSNRISVLKMK